MILTCIRCGGPSRASSAPLRLSELAWGERHRRKVSLFVCAADHRMLLAGAPLEDATKPAELELASSIARGGMAR